MLAKEVKQNPIKIDPSIFRAYDIRGIVGQSLTPELVTALGKAIATTALRQGEKTIVVGRDGRLSGPEMSNYLIKGILATGCNVINVGMVPTPVLYYATNILEGKSGVMVTGSHNPPNYNGFKMVIRGHTLAEQEIQQLRQQIEQQDFLAGAGFLRQVHVTDNYIEQIKQDIQITKPLKVVVDCGSGVAGGVAPRLLTALGCEVIPLYCEVDGTFPHHHPDPSKPENLKDLIAAVKTHQADLGVAFDGDGDRLGVVTPAGEMVFPDRIMMLYAKDVLANNPGATIVFDVKCSLHLARVIQAAGGNPIMSRTGHSLIKAKIKETKALLAGEMSGHLFFNDRWYGFDDALYSAARLLEIISQSNKTAEQLFAECPSGICTPELQIKVTDENKFNLIDQLVKQGQFPGAELIIIDGVRAEFSDGWGLVRASNTTPVLVLRFEGDTETTRDRIMQLFKQELLKIDASLKVPF